MWNSLSSFFQIYTEVVESISPYFIYFWFVFIVPLVSVVLYYAVFRKKTWKRWAAVILSVISLLSVPASIVLYVSKNPVNGIMVDSFVMVFDIVYSILFLAHIILPIVFIIVLMLKKNTKKKTVVFLVLETISLAFIIYICTNQIGDLVP